MDAKHVRLEVLNLPENQITSLPEELDNLRIVRKLKLGKNPIVEIPESIFQLPNLEELDLKNCGIPKDVGKQIKKRLKGVKVKT